MGERAKWMALFWRVPQRTVERAAAMLWHALGAVYTEVDPLEAAIGLLANDRFLRREYMELLLGRAPYGKERL